jgi:hypothetical protein
MAGLPFQGPARPRIRRVIAARQRRGRDPGERAARFSDYIQIVAKRNRRARRGPTLSGVKL